MKKRYVLLYKKLVLWQSGGPVREDNRVGLMADVELIVVTVGGPLPDLRDQNIG